MVVIKNNLKVLMARWEVEKGAKLTIRQLSEWSDVGFQTVYRYMNNTQVGFDLTVCERLISWFGSQGMTVTMNDLFTIEHANAHQHEDLVQHLIVTLPSVFRCELCKKVLRFDSLEMAVPEDGYNCDDGLFYLDCYHCNCEIEIDVIEVRSLV